MIFSVIGTMISLVVFLFGLHSFSYTQLLVLFLAVVGFSYNAVRIYTKRFPEKKEHYLNMYYRGILAFYFFFLFSLTFNIERATAEITFDGASLMRRLTKESNLIPFRTIHNMFRNNDFNSFFFINIVGNVAALMPLGILFPLVFSKARKILPYTFMVIGVVLFIEFFQFFFGVGRLDVDDLILNVSGALVAYGGYRIFVFFVKR